MALVSYPPPPLFTKKMKHLKEALTAMAGDQPQLLVFFHVASTGLSSISSKIVEIGAQIFQHWKNQYVKVKNGTFEELVRINEKMPHKASAINGIMSEDLQDAVPFDGVFMRFSHWLKQNLEKNSRDSKSHHQLVFVAHNGFVFDFPLLLSELERHDVGFSFLVDNEVKFSDTLEYKKEFLKLNPNNYSLPYIYEKCFPRRKFKKKKRALYCASRLAKVVKHLKIPVIDKSKAFDDIKMQWRQRTDKEKLKRFHLKPYQLKSVLSKSLSYERLMEIFLDSCDSHDFEKNLRAKGIRSSRTVLKLYEVLRLEV